MDPRLLRKCLGRFATGVTVVTCQGPQTPHGLTVNSFTSVSLQPPLVLVSIGRQTHAYKLLQRSAFAVNVLGAEQENVAWHFAGRADAELQVTWEEGRIAPRLRGALAHIECSPWRNYDGGDHVLVVGKVEHFEVRDGAPLVFYESQFHRLPSIEEVAQ